MMKQEELNLVVQQHGEWLSSKGEIGQQAIMENADLRQVDLSGVDLSYAVLTGANFDRARLDKAVLINTDMREANFSYSHLSLVDMTGANLTKARFEGADLKNANLSRVVIDHACFSHAALRNARLNGVRGFRVYFDQADLSCASIETAVLETVCFTSANLTNASLSDSYLQKADFSDAKLPGSHFDNAILEHIRSDSSLVPSTIESETAQIERIVAIRAKYARSFQHALLIGSYIFQAVAALALFACLLFGLVDLFGFIFTSAKLTEGTGFNYLGAIGIGVVASIMAGIALFSRLFINKFSFPLMTEFQRANQHSLVDDKSTALQHVNTKGRED
jgi:uncharacterized protein YjbI with pentapeptide repeats